MSRLRAIDLDDETLRDALVETIRAADPANRQLAFARAEVIMAGVYAVIADVCEDLEPTLARLRADGIRAGVRAQQSAGRVAALEHALGIERAVRGEVVSPS